MHWKPWRELCRPKMKGGMGFRSLISFNKAMLAKQIWRLLTRPNSLIARMYKANYYPSEDIMECKLRPSASFIWKSLLWSRELIQKGTRWRVGDGETIEVFRDAWILGLNNGKLISGNWNATRMKVKDLMNGDRGWNEAVIRSMMLPCEVPLITEIDLTNRGGPDMRFWAMEEKGCYSVKSGYRLDAGELEGHHAKSGDEAASWWKSFWKMEVLPKIKIFGWKAFNGAIPVEFQLRRHHVPTDGICWGCRRDWGTTSHTLIFCDKVRPMWKESCFWSELSTWRGRDFTEVMLWLSNRLTKEQFAIWLTMVWIVWRRLCKAKHEGIELNCWGTVDEAQSLLENYKKARRQLAATHASTQKLEIRRWLAPPVDSYRLDVDAHFNPKRGTYGAGAIV